MAYRMTAARKAALRKAQAASARKRRRGRRTKPVKNKRNLQNLAREDKRRRAYAKKNYKGAGAIYKANRDLALSRGAYANNAYGNRVSKVRRGFRAARGVATLANPIAGGMIGASYVRGVRKGTLANPTKKARTKARAAGRRVKRTAKRAWG